MTPTDGPVALHLAATAPPAVRKALLEADLSRLLTDGTRQRFEQLTKPAESGCIEWQGATNGTGYGKFCVRAGLTTPAHCAAWIMHYRSPIPVYLELDHVCVNTMCVRVDHLEAVTHEENQRRMFERRKVRLVRAATVRQRRGKHQVRWREHVNGVVTERGRTFDLLDDAQRFALSLGKPLLEG